MWIYFHLFHLRSYVFQLCEIFFIFLGVCLFFLSISSSEIWSFDGVECFLIFFLFSILQLFLLALILGEMKVFYSTLYCYPSNENFLKILLSYF